MADLNKLMSMSDDELDGVIEQLLTQSSTPQTTQPRFPTIDTSVPVEPPGFVSSNLKKGFATTGQMIGGALRFAGAEDLGNQTADYWRQASQEYEQARPTMRIKDVGGPLDALKFVGEQTLQMAPLALTAVPAAVAGGALGAATGVGAGIGGAVGATLGSIGTEAGIISAEADKNKPLDRAQVLKGAIPAGILETIPELVGLKLTGLGKKAIAELEKKYGKEIAGAAVEKAASEGWLKTGAKAMGDLALIGASEGMTESAQSPLEAWGAGNQVFKEGQSFEQAPLTNTLGALTGGIFGGQNYTPEMKDEMLESFAAGAAGGLGMGGGGKVLNKTLDFMQGKPAPVITNDSTPAEVVDGTDIDAQVKEAFNAERALKFGEAPSGAQGDLFGGFDVNATEQQPILMPSQAPGMPVMTSPTDPYFPNQRMQDVTSFNEIDRPEAKAPIINPALDRIFDKAMRDEIKSLVKDPTNPAQVQAAIEKTYKKYASMRDAQSFNVEGVSTPETQMKTTENKAKAHYVTSVMENSPEFNRAPSIAKELAKRPVVETETHPELDFTGGEQQVLPTEQETSGALAQPKPVPDKLKARLTNITRTETPLEVQGELDLGGVNEVKDHNATVGVAGTTEDLVEDVGGLDTDLMETDDLEEAPTGLVTANVANIPRRGSVASEFSTDTNNAERVHAELSPLLEKLTGGRASLSIVDGELHSTDKAGNSVRLEGETIDTLVHVVSNAKDPAGVARHETIHVLKNLKLFTPQEWNILSAKANKWIKDFNIAKDYPNLDREGQVEEAIARAYQNGVDKNTSLMKRIAEFFERIWNAFKQGEFTSASDVFRKIEEGEVGVRPFSTDIASDGLSKPAIDNRAFIEKHKKLKWGNLLDHFEDTIKSLGGKEVSERGDFDKFIDQFEPNFKKSDFNYSAKANLLTGSYVDFARESGIINPIVQETPRVFKAFDAYEKTLRAIVEDNSGKKDDEALDTPIMGLADLNTAGELRKHYFKVMQAIGDLHRAATSGEFMSYVNALDTLEELGFGSYKVRDKDTRKVTTQRYYDRVAAIKMFTWFHLGTSSEVALPEWHVFAEDGIKKNLEHYKRSYQKYVDMYYGMGDAMLELGKDTITNLIRKSQLVKDVRDNMTGASKDVFVMRGYSPKDRNFVAMHVLRLFESFGLVAFNDMYGDVLQKSYRDKRADGISYEFSALRNVSSDFDNLDQKNSIIEYLANQAVLNEEGAVEGEEEQSAGEFSDDQMAAMVGRPLRTSTYPMAHKDDFKVHGHPEAVALLAEGAPAHTAAKAFFEKAGYGGLFSQVIQGYKSNNDGTKLINNLIHLATKAMADVYNTTPDQVMNPKVLQAIEILTHSNVANVLHDEDVDTVRSRDEKIEGENVRKSKYMDVLRGTWGDDPYIKFLKESQEVRQLGDFEAPVSFSFGISHMAGKLYTISRSHGDQKTRANALENLVHLVALHAANPEVDKDTQERSYGFGIFPPTMRKDYVVKKVLSLFDADKVELIPIDKVTANVSEEDRAQLRAIITQELNLTSASKHTLYNKIIKLVEEDKTPAEVSLKDMPRYDKDTVREHIQDLIVKFLDDESSDYGAITNILTKYLKRFHNGLVTAKVQGIDPVAMATLTEFIRMEKASNIAKGIARKKGEMAPHFAHTEKARETIANLSTAINTILDSMADEYVPMFDVAKYTPKPAVDINKLFSDYESRSAFEKKAIQKVYIPEIGNIVSDIIGEDIYTLLVSDRQDSDKLKVEFRMDSPAIRMSAKEYAKAKASADKVRKEIFDNEATSFTLIRNVANTVNQLQPFVKSYFTHEFKEGDVLKSGAFVARDTTLAVPMARPTGSTHATHTKDERVNHVAEGHGVIHGEAGPEQKYVSINPERLYTGPFRDIQSELEARAKYLEKKLNGLIEDIITKYSMNKTYVLPFVENFNKYMGYVYDPSINSHIEKEFTDADITDPNLFSNDPALDMFKVPMTVYEDMVKQINSDMEEFVYGRPDMTTSRYIAGVAKEGKHVEKPSSMRTRPETSPVDNIWMSKKDGSLYKVEMSLQGLAGNQSIRYYPFDAGARRNIRIMSVKAFKENFEAVPYDYAQYSKDTFKEPTTGLPVHSDLRNIELTSEFRTALNDISKPVAQKLEEAFFTATGIYNALKKSKEKFKELNSNQTVEPSMEMLVKALNMQTFSAEKIALWILKEEGTSKALKEYPAVVAEVNRGLLALQDAGFLEPSMSERSDKLKQGSVSAKGRKFLLTKKLRGMIEDAHTRRKLQTQAAVWTEAMTPFVEEDGSFKNVKGIFTSLKKLAPPGTSEMRIFQVVKNIFRVPYFAAEMIREKFGSEAALNMLKTSNRREYIRDLWKSKTGEVYGNYKNFFTTLPEDMYKKANELFTWADAKQEIPTFEQAKKQFGVSKEVYDNFINFTKEVKEKMPEVSKHGGAVAYITKFEVLFKVPGLVERVEQAVGSKWGSLDRKEASALAREIMPAEITDKKWQDRFVKHVIGYNDFMGSQKANIANTKFWMPRVRKIGKFTVTARDADNNKVAHAFFDTTEEAEIFKNKLEAKDASVWKYKDIPKGDITAKVEVTPDNQFGLFSTMDSAQEYQHMQTAFDAEDAQKFQTPWFGNSALENEEIGSVHVYERRNKDLILGYATDDFFANYETAFARMAMSYARMEYGQTQLGHLAQMKKDGEKKLGLQKHIDEFKKHLVYDLKRPSHTEKLGGELKRATAFYYMGWGFLGGLINSMQPFTVGAPELAKLYGAQDFTKNMGKALKDLAKWTHFAGKYYIQHINEPDKKRSWVESGIIKAIEGLGGNIEGFDTKLPENYQAALNKYSRSGLLNSMFNDMVFNNSLDEGDIAEHGESYRYYKNFVEQSLSIFKITEVINREGSFLAAYDHAYKTAPEGVDKDEYAYKVAEEFVAGTQYIVNKFNMPLTYKQLPSGVGTALYALMSYPFNMINQLYKHGYKATVGKDMDSAKIILGIMIMTFALGGMDGLPFKDFAEFVWSKMGAYVHPQFSGNFDMDMKRILRTGNVPDQMQRLLLGGLPTLAGANISKNIGMQTPFLSAFSGSKTPVESLSGASGGLIKRGYDTLKNAGQGKFQEAMFENIAPEFVARASRAQRLYTEGQVSAGGTKRLDSSGKPIKETGAEALAAAVGIKSDRWANIQEERQSQRELKEKLSRMRESARKAALLDHDYKPLQKYNQYITTKGLVGLSPLLKNVKDAPDKKTLEFQMSERNRTF